MLLERVGQFSAQVAGFVNDNPNLNHVLEQLRTISDILKDRKFDLVDTLSTLSKFTASLAEAIASGPFFKVLLVNILPPWLLQPFVDSAFKKRGIDPEEFWRNAGLPSWRFPDPNGTRFPNGAPAPGPEVAGRHACQSRTRSGRGSPVLVHADGRTLPRPGDPLPCSHLSTGPFGPNPYSTPGGQGYTLPDVLTSPPNPNGPGFTPGVPAAAVPGQLPPDMGGVPAPLPPAPPGARTVPVGPLPPEGPDFTPGIAPLPPALDGPPPPPGPGPAPGPAGAACASRQPAVPSTRFAERVGGADMSTIFNVRNLKLPNVSRTAVIIGAIVVVLALIAGVVGWQLYKKLTNNSVVAYFPETLALYPGDKVQIMGVKVGSIDSIEPAGDKMKVTFHYENKYKVPANATASILNPSLVASRTIQLSPPYTGGPVMENNATIPIDRTQVPVEYDELRDSLNRILTDLGPTPEQPKGPFGDVIESFSDGLAGKGEQLNKTLTGLSEAVTTLNEGRGDFFAVIKSLALFVNALYKSDQQFVALNNDLAQFTNSFTNTDNELANGAAGSERSADDHPKVHR